MAISYDLTYRNPSFIAAVLWQAWPVLGPWTNPDIIPPSGSSQPSEGNKHSHKTSQCSWTIAAAKLFQNTMDKRERASESAGPGRGSYREAKKGFVKGRASI